MHVFIMWAGERSHAIARELKGFLEFVVRGPKYFISDDIEGGRLWRVAIAGQLEASSFGIACLTHDNLRSHWLHFEAGALSKAVGQAHVIPFLVGPKTTDVDGPLSDFQMISCDEAGVRKMVSLLTAQVPDTPVDVVDKSFGYVWPDFKQKLTKTQTESSGEPAEPVRSESAIIQEILDRVRRLEARSEAAPVYGHKRPERPDIPKDDVMLRVMKNQVLTLINDLEPHTINPSMDDAIEKWREYLKKSELTVEEILKTYQSARSLEAYLNR